MAIRKDSGKSTTPAELKVLQELEYELLRAGVNYDKLHKDGDTTDDQWRQHMNMLSLIAGMVRHRILKGTFKGAIDINKAMPLLRDRGYPWVKDHDPKVAQAFAMELVEYLQKQDKE